MGACQLPAGMGLADPTRQGGVMRDRGSGRFVGRFRSYSGVSALVVCRHPTRLKLVRSAPTADYGTLPLGRGFGANRSQQMNRQSVEQASALEFQPERRLTTHVSRAEDEHRRQFPPDLAHGGSVSKVGLL